MQSKSLHPSSSHPQGSLPAPLSSAQGWRLHPVPTIIALCRLRWAARPGWWWPYCISEIPLYLPKVTQTLRKSSSRRKPAGGTVHRAFKILEKVLLLSFPPETLVVVTSQPHLSRVNQAWEGAQAASSFPACENVTLLFAAVWNGPPSLLRPCFYPRERNSPRAVLAMFFTSFLFGFLETPSYSLAKKFLQGEAHLD